MCNEVLVQHSSEIKAFNIRKKNLFQTQITIVMPLMLWKNSDQIKKIRNQYCEKNNSLQILLLHS